MQTPETPRRFAELEGPGVAVADTAALERIQQGWALTEAPGPYPGPTVVVTGRQDSLVGYATAWSWLDDHPRATFAVLDLAGHSLPHEQSGLLDALLSEWLDPAAPG